MDEKQDTCQVGHQGDRHHQEPVHLGRQGERCWQRWTWWADCRRVVQAGSLAPGRTPQELMRHAHKERLAAPLLTGG